MSRILLASELGAGYGHLAKIRLLAEAFSTRGQRVMAAHPNVSMLRLLGEDVVVAGVDTPRWPVMPKGAGPAVSYAEILERVGYCVPGRLREMIQRWLFLYAETKPDLVTVDHAPTAMLAARCAGVPCVRIGTGFQSPPARTPLPSLLDHADATTDARSAVEERVLGFVNEVLQASGASIVETLSDALVPAEDFLCTFAELDHYPTRARSRYWGPLFLHDQGRSPQWPDGPGPKIFAYVAGRMAGLPALCKTLQDLGYPALVHARGLSLIARTRLQSEHVRLVGEPLHLRKVARASRVLIGHGSHGFNLVALLGGKPLVILPQQVEQLMIARRLQEQGLAALAYSGATAEHSLNAAIRRMLETGSYAKRAKEFARRHQGYDPRATAKRIARQCEPPFSNT